MYFPEEIERIQVCITSVITYPLFSNNSGTMLHSFSLETTEKSFNRVSQYNGYINHSGLAKNMQRAETFHPHTNSHKCGKEKNKFHAYFPFPPNYIIAVLTSTILQA